MTPPRGETRVTAPGTIAPNNYLLDSSDTEISVSDPEPDNQDTRRPVSIKLPYPTRSAMKEIETKWECPECGSKLINKKGLRDHCRRSHPKRFLEICG